MQAGRLRYSRPEERQRCSQVGSPLTIDDTHAQLVAGRLGITAVVEHIRPMDRTMMARYRERLEAWQRAEPALDEMRRKEIRESTAEGIRAVIPTAELLQRLGIELSASTGLIEQQAWFAKLRHG